MEWVSIDPGETTGLAFWSDGRLVEARQEALWDMVDELADTHERYGLFVVEDWRLYPWELKSLAWDACRTARAIGALELITRLHGIRLVLQPAKIKEAAEAAGAAELFLSPLHENRHLNDAIRHGVYYLAQQRRAGAPAP